MPKKAVLLFTFLALVACFLSYKLGSAPVALAKARPAQQEEAAPPPLPTAPTTWTLNSAPGIHGVSPTVTRAAGGSGVKHVATCISVRDYNTGSTANTEQVFLRDGPSGTGAVLAEWLIGITSTVNDERSVDLCDLNIVGSANTAMTLEFGTMNNLHYANVLLIGYDAQ
jgi:hypothetical protein